MMRPQTTQRIQQPPVSARWLFAALFAALVIAGLLGMHTLSTAHSDVHVAAASTGTTTMDAAHMHSAPGSMDADADSGCLDCGQGGSHHAMSMACVLGLLVTLLLVCRARPSLVGSRGPSIVAPFLSAVGALLPRPPSLITLSISRT